MHTIAKLVALLCAKHLFSASEPEQKYVRGRLPDLTQTGLVEKSAKIGYYKKNQVILKQDARYARRHFLFQIWDRQLWKVMLKGRNMLVLWKYVKEQSLLVTFSRRKRFLQGNAGLRKDGKHQVACFQQKDRTGIKSAEKKMALRKEQHKAEILWALKSIMSHFSYRSTCDVVDVFKAMFPDSNIAQGKSCGPVNLSYLITFGIALYF